MDDIIDRMRTAQVIAGWDAAREVMNRYGSQNASLAIQHMVGQGLSQADADLLIYYVLQFALEAK